MGIKANTLVKKLSSFSIAEQKRIIAAAIQNSTAAKKTGPNDSGPAILEFANGQQATVEVTSSIGVDRKRRWYGSVTFNVPFNGFTDSITAARVFMSSNTNGPLLVFYRLINATFMNSKITNLTGLCLPFEIVQVVEHYLKEVENGKA